MLSHPIGVAADLARVFGSVPNAAHAVYYAEIVREKATFRALINASGIPPENDLEPAIEMSLTPGAYTAILRGNNGTSGLGIIEIYNKQ